MKRVATLLIILISLNLLSAIEFDIQEEYDQGETLITKLSGNFLKPILESDIYFYRAHIRVPIIPKLVQINEDYYISAILPENNANYSIEIKNAKYMQGSKTVEEDIKRNFTISEKKARFNVDPGIISTDGDFSLKVQNLISSLITIKIDVDSVSSEDAITLKSGEIENIDFSVSNIINSQLKEITLSSDSFSYQIPLYLFPNASHQESSKEVKLEFEPSFTFVNASTGIERTRIIYLKNIGDNEVKNINLSISSSLEEILTLSVYEIDSLKKNESVKIELYLKSVEEPGDYSGKIYAKTGGKSFYSELYINFIKAFIPADGDEDIPITTQTCSEIQGKICPEGTSCEGYKEYTSDGLCCLGTCKEPSSGLSMKILGWTLVIIIIILGAWFFLTKYRGAGNKPVNLLNFSRKR